MPDSATPDGRYDMNPTDPIDDPESQTLQVLAETAKVAIRRTETGRVRVTTRTETDDEIVHRDLSVDTVEVSRLSVNRTLEPGEALPVQRTEGDVTIIPIFEEIVVIEKCIVLKEEVHLTRTRTMQGVDIPVQLRRQTATIERIDPED